jgi:hypothetical protein
MADHLYIASIKNTNDEKFYFRVNRHIHEKVKDISVFWRREITKSTVCTSIPYLSSLLSMQLKFAYDNKLSINTEIGELILETLTIETFDLSASQKVFRSEQEILDDFMNNELPKLMNEINAMKENIIT